jgi:hypothetical protein
MQNFLRFSGAVASALAFAISAPSAVALEKTSVWTCQGVGDSPPEPLGDREGHSIHIGQNSCRVESGTYVGGVSIEEETWEWDGPKAVELSGSGVVRKPGSTLTWKETEGEMTLTMTDGKVTGWTASGGGVNSLATGDWASLAGKRYHWTAKSVGPGSQFSVESKQE